MHFHGPAPHVEGSDVVRGVRFLRMYHLCPDPVTPQAPSQGRTACDFTTATISLEVFFKPHCTCEEDIYLLHGKEELSNSNKIPTSSIVSLCQGVG